MTATHMSQNNFAQVQLHANFCNKNGATDEKMKITQMQKISKKSYMAANHAVSSSSADRRLESLRRICSLFESSNNRITPLVLPAMQLNAKQAFLLHPPTSDSNISVNLHN